MKNLFLWIILLIITPLYGVQAQSNDLGKELAKAQIEYYKAQKGKLLEKKTFWQSAKDNPASVLGVLGAVLAALVALISFIANYRATLRTQIDIQFYEALKRFGDKDSAAIRSTAAGLLAQMGIRRERNYFHITLNQFITGLQLEENDIVLDAISDAMIRLTMYRPVWAFTHLYTLNIKLQEKFVEALAAYCAGFSANITETNWHQASSITGYQEFVLMDFKERFSGKFSNSFNSASNALTLLPPDKKTEHLINLQDKFRIAANRLRSNVTVCSKTLGYIRPSKKKLIKKILQLGLLRLGVFPKDESINFFLIDYKGLFLVNGNLRFAQFRRSSLFGWQDKVSLTETHLQGSDLRNTNLSNINLQLAQLQGADLSYADLHGTNLWHAQIDLNTKFEEVEWWKADFYGIAARDYQDTIDRLPKEKDLDFGEVKIPAAMFIVDESLLEKLYSRYSNKIPEDLDKVSGSVRIFLEKKRKNPS